MIVIKKIDIPVINISIHTFLNVNLKMTLT